MPVDTAPDLAKSFSSSKPPDTTTQKCAYTDRKVVQVRWETPLAWCSEVVTYSGTTVNYPNGETLPVSIFDHASPSDTFASQTATISGNAFRNNWKVIDVLPVRDGKSGYKVRREIGATADCVTTPLPTLGIGFIVNLKDSDASGYGVKYDRTNPKVPATATTPEVPEEKTKVSITSQYVMNISNYLVTLKGNLNYVRGWGKEYVQLGDKTLTGSFKLYGDDCHWGKYDPVTTKWSYWDGSAWQPAPASWKPDNSNHFSASFYSDGSKWICREDSSITYPETITEWPKNLYEGAGNLKDTVLAKWKGFIESRWSDKFDIKRDKCESTKAECCRYRVVVEAKFTPVAAIADGVIVIGYENFRSDSTLWSLGDDRDGLAPHEFGHLLGAPDEYAGVFSTQLGVSDSDGLKDGLDDDCLMGVGLSNVKKRHFKGIVEVMGLFIKQVFGKDYTYSALPRGTTIDLPAGTPTLIDQGPTKPPPPVAPPGGSGFNIGHAVLGALAGAAAGAAAGFFASGGNPLVALGGAVLGALAGAAAGWIK